MTNTLLQVISRLMHDVAIPEMAFNMFSLVRDPEQETLDEWSTKPLVGDFEPGFTGKTNHEMRKMFINIVKEKTTGISTSIGKA